MDLKDLADVSPHLLMEDSADSEADFVHSRVTAVYRSNGKEDDDDDDAESCSCDSWEVSGSHADDRDDRDSRDQWNDSGQRSSTLSASGREAGLVSRDVDEEEEPWVDGGNGDLNKEEMDAMEDKVFWETCMAVGYP